MVLDAVWPPVLAAVAQHHQVRPERTQGLQQLVSMLALCKHGFNISYESLPLLLSLMTGAPARVAHLLLQPVLALFPAGLFSFSERCRLG